MAKFTLSDFTEGLTSRVEAVAVQWLHEISQTVAADANSHVKMKGDAGVSPRGSYEQHVAGHSAEVGSGKESAFWEEYGTGAYAEHGDGRKGWWVYIQGQERTTGGKSYPTQQDAEAAADYIREKHKKNAVVTNGTKPHHTLENAFVRNRPKAQQALSEKIGGVMGT